MGAATSEPEPDETAPPIKILQAVTFKYEGSYTRLVSFLQRCEEKGVIDDEQYNDLMAAVEDINRRGEGQAVDSQNAWFGGDREVVSKSLSAYGISTHDEKGPKGKTAESSEHNEHCEYTALDTIGDVDLAAILSDTAFLCRSRGDVAADAQMVVYGFTTPYNLVDRYQIDKNILNSWVHEIAGQYLANPYHNWMHALDVYQFCYLSLAAGKGGEHFNFQDILALLSATICHDVGHPGTTNAFLINTGADLAITYNDRSPLESMHASIVFETMARPGMNWLTALSDHDFKVYRGKVIDCILATDMAHHFEFLDRFAARVAKMGDNPFATDTKHNKEKQKSSKEDRRMLMQAFTHMADLGNGGRPWDVYKQLCVSLEEEFFSQGDQERSLGIPIMPMMDRTKDSLATGQGFFLEKLVLPLMEPYFFFIAPELGKTFMDNLKGNKETWAELIVRHGKKTAVDLLSLEDVVPPPPSSSAAAGQEVSPDAAAEAARA